MLDRQRDLASAGDDVDWHGGAVRPGRSSL